jgi:uncharacterized protein YjiK
VKIYLQTILLGVLCSFAYCNIALAQNNISKKEIKIQKKGHKLKAYAKTILSIPEPSDIALSANGKSFFVVSDNGFLFETDLKGTVIRQASHNAFDLEAVYADENFVYAVDERTRIIHFYSLPDLKHVREVEVSYLGGRNKGFEGLTYNPTTKRYILAIEKDPTMFFELDQDFKVVNRIDFKGPSDVSSITWHNGAYYVMSDEEHCMLKVNVDTYAIEKRYRLDILNPEGLAFMANNELVVVSDDMQTMYNYSDIEIVLSNPTQK